MIPIKWSKRERTGKMQYTTMDDKLLTVNPGKTYIAAFPISEEKNLKIK